MSVSNIDEWSRWVRLNQGDINNMQPLDIKQVPGLVNALRQNFFQEGKELAPYKGLYDIARDYLPLEGSGCEE